MPAGPERESFLAMHVPGRPLVVPNPWDVGSALLLRSLGFRALATTSSGRAAQAGLDDGRLGRALSIDYAREVAETTGLPVTADLEDGFGDLPQDVADTVAAAVRAGLDGCSVEDFTGSSDAPIRERAAAVERVRAAAEASAGRLVLTARAENHIHGNPDLADTIARLQAYQEAGADVLYAPGLTDPRDVRSLIASVDRPVNVLARPGLDSVAVLAGLGAARISVGGALMFAAYEALAGYAQRLREGDGPFLWFDEAARGAAALARSRHGDGA